MFTLFLRKNMTELMQECIALYDLKKYDQIVISLLENADQYQLNGHLWKSLIIDTLLETQNSFTLACQRNAIIQDEMLQLFEADMDIFFQLYHIKFKCDNDLLNQIVENYQSTKKIIYQVKFEYSNHLQSLLNQTKNTHEFSKIMQQHYQRHGSGKYALSKAFHYQSKQICSIMNVSNDSFDQLTGCTYQTSMLCMNTEAFLKGKLANNVLLYGDSGTGKSTSIKALLNKYFNQGLRMIEVYKHQFIDLPQIIDTIQQSNYKFIIFMDDLSFEDFEIEYKYLKAIIEGGLAQKTKNILIYATSNRRQLIKQTWDQRVGDEISVNDTKQETQSLSSRFGISILYGQPNKMEYLQIIDQLQVRYHIKMDNEKLHQEALRHAMRYGGYSGRTAMQFIQTLQLD